MLVPEATVVATPAGVIVSVLVSLDDHIAVAVTSAIDASEYVAMAVKGKVTPVPKTGAVGVNAIETSFAPVT